MRIVDRGEAMKRVNFSDEVKEMVSTAPAQQQAKSKSDTPDSTTPPKARLSEKKKKDDPTPTSRMREPSEDSESDDKILYSEPVAKQRKSSSADAASVEVDQLASRLLDAAAKKSADKLKDELEWMERRGLRFDRPPLSSNEKIKKFKTTIVVDLLQESGEKISKTIAGLVSRLLILGCDPNSVDKSGNTPLMLACKAGHKDLMMFMINQCPAIKLHAVNSDGRNAAMVASEAGQKHLLLALDRAGISLHPKNPAIIFYTLVQHVKGEADYSDRVDIVKSLLKQGDYLNLVDESGKTLLMHATLQSDIEMINALLHFGLGPMVHIRDADGKDVFAHAKALENKYSAHLILQLIDDNLNRDY